MKPSRRVLPSPGISRYADRQFQQASAPAPQALTLINGWRKDSENDPNTPAYYKDAEGLVHLEGAVECSSGSSGCGNSTFATLPAGFRPNHQLFLTSYMSGGVAGLHIKPNGEFNVYGTPDDPNGPKSYASLEGVTFRAVQ